MPSLDSSAISCAEYDWNSAQLYITFCSGDTAYTFYRVPAYVYEGLINATSPGTYYHDHICGRYGL